MSQHQPKLDRSLSGATHPERHRLRRMLGMLTILTFVMVVLVAAAVTARVLVHRHAARDVPAADDALEEVLVTDEQAPPQEPEVAAGESEATEEATQEPVELHLMAIGDILMHDGVIQSGGHDDGTFNYDHLFAAIADDVAAADVAVLNQETILGGSAWAYSGYPVFNSPQEVGDAEVAVGFDVVLKATNHTLDLGYDGVRAELAWWREAHPEMKVIGAADPDGDGVCPAGGTSAAGACLVEKDGLTVALLNYTDILNGNVDPSYDGNVVSIMSEEGVRADVAAARERGADLVVVFAHWGDEYVTEPTERERWWASVMQDAGVDVVIGGHPHVIQPVEVLDDGQRRMLVMWSVGNFVSTQVGAANMVGGMAKVTFVKDVDGARVTSYEFVPTVTQREGRSPAMRAYKLPDYTDELAAASSVSLIDNGNGSTRQWYVDYCADVLGEAFDRETLSVHGTL